MFRQELITAIIQDIAELPDRTSPDDWPEAMLVTSDELYRILSFRFDRAAIPDGVADIRRTCRETADSRSAIYKGR